MAEDLQHEHPWAQASVVKGVFDACGGRQDLARLQLQQHREARLQYPHKVSPCTPLSPLPHESDSPSGLPGNSALCVEGGSGPSDVIMDGEQRVAEDLDTEELSPLPSPASSPSAVGTGELAMPAQPQVRHTDPASAAEEGEGSDEWVDAAAELTPSDAPALDQPLDAQLIENHFEAPAPGLSPIPMDLSRWPVQTGQLVVTGIRLCGKVSMTIAEQLCRRGIAAAALAADPKALVLPIGAAAALSDLQKRAVHSIIIRVPIAGPKLCAALQRIVPTTIADGAIQGSTGLVSAYMRGSVLGLIASLLCHQTTDVVRLLRDGAEPSAYAKTTVVNIAHTAGAYGGGVAGTAAGALCIGAVGGICGGVAGMLVGAWAAEIVARKAVAPALPPPNLSDSTLLVPHSNDCGGDPADGCVELMLCNAASVEPSERVIVECADLPKEGEELVRSSVVEHCRVHIRSPNATNDASV